MTEVDVRATSHGSNIEPSRWNRPTAEASSIDREAAEVLLGRARDGEPEAWRTLVSRYDALLRAITRSFRLDDATAGDVVQTVWLRLFENVDRIRDPERLAGWLAATTRREALRVLRAQRRYEPSDAMESIPDRTASQPDEMVVAEELQRTIADAISWESTQLGPRSDANLRVRVSVGESTFVGEGEPEAVLRAYGLFRKQTETERYGVATGTRGSHEAEQPSAGHDEGDNGASLKAFLAGRDLRSNADVAAAISAWAKLNLGQQEISPLDVQRYWRMAGRGVPSNVSRDLGAATARGLLARIGNGRYAVTASGERYVDKLLLDSALAT